MTVTFLGLATTVTGFIAKYAWTTRKMIYNKSTERLAVGTRLAEIALKAVTHAVNFKAIKEAGGHSGISLTVDDLASALSDAGAPVTKPQALQIAKLCILRSNDDDPGSHKDIQEMDYMEYMGGLRNAGVEGDSPEVAHTTWPRHSRRILDSHACPGMEAGGMINFDEFMSTLERRIAKGHGSLAALRKASVVPEEQPAQGHGWETLTAPPVHGRDTLT